jgi:hypothetical protein
MGVVYRKTQKGVEELSSRKLKLNPRVRTMLILVDGMAPEEALRHDASQVGAPEDFLEQLQAMGLIEARPGVPGPAASAAAGASEAVSDAEFQRFREALAFMNHTAVDALGIKAFFFTLKLDRAATRADLRELADAYVELIAKASGKEQASVLARRLKLLLA